MYENDALSGQYQKESFHLFHIMNLIQISQKIVFIYIYTVPNPSTIIQSKDQTTHCEQALGSSGKENLPFNRRKLPAEPYINTEILPLENLAKFFNSFVLLY